MTSVGTDNYTYDANGNMLTRVSQNITWDAENRPIQMTSGNGTSAFVYDGDGMRVQKTEGGENILYVNKYFEKNLTTVETTTYYYLGDRRVAMRKNTTLQYIHQDHLASTAVVTSDNGTQVGAIKYYPYGYCRTSQGDLGTDKLFTGQRLDDTGLYYYGARYYDPTIGRFISPDTIVPNPMNPQTFNRYSYALNNPLKYVEPTGHQYEDDWYYYSLCEANGIDPGAGVALFLGEGSEVVGTVVISTFVSWVESSPEPFDYISQSATQSIIEKAGQVVGIERVFDYHENLTADPITVVELGNNSIPIKSLNRIGFGAITIDPNIYIPEGAIPKSGNLLGSSIGKEEYAHILQQRQDPDFYRNYISEYWQGFLYYGDLTVSYEHISYEQLAKIFAGIKERYEWTPYGPPRYLDLLPLDAG